MSNKFNIGDKVLIRRDNTRTPKELSEGIRLDHPRTITRLRYDYKAQHTLYFLGTNRRGEVDASDFYFRASQLKLWDKGKVGHPRVKRRYRRRLVKPQGIINTQ